MTQSWHTIGEIRSVNPARRELRVRPERGRGSAFDGCDWVWVRRGRSEPVRYRVAKARLAGDEIIAELAAGVPRDEVRGLNGARVVSDESAAPSNADYALADLIGLSILERGQRLGVVVDALESPAHDVVEMERDDGSRAMVPLAPELVTAIDFDAGRIEMSEAPAVESAAASSG